MKEEILKKARRVFDIEIGELLRLRDCIDDNLARAVEIILSCEGKVITTGVGKSGHIAQKIASTLSSTGTPAHFLHPSEALHGDLGVIDHKDVLLAVSNSGESPEVVSLIPYVKLLKVPIIAITNREDSTLARYADVHLFLNVKKEACPLELAPTSSSTASLVLGDAIAMVLLELRGFTKEDFALRHPAGSLGRKLRVVRELYHTGEEVPIVYEDTPMPDVIIEMTSKGFGATAVIDKGGKLVGIITDGDLRRFVRRGGNFNTSTAKDVMTKNPKTVKSDELAAEALKKMEEHKITVLIVIDDEGRPEGIIHMHDILRAGVL
ncbi:KpsF/GutQ family protein [Hydrogenobacter thermophilus TK-6]|uniref:KpsF/GutQ family protein n=1 Tax=Hydrogenobacter thermophilus (strain DSM 6534 / IAM 12695 / TK-6) TaxID=608538 RepID=D3DJQ8_HYDTT|nr:KpsF/GutQ family sugar-phosphate isomerase [Hydrogenobacter thermophilus]ADO45983.1 KpsF/GutQ family protein [Hydrogenobacter thermophilus TK-6]BAI70060.1 KpsF/GutQ family protein [Hydrogenobacter thermophilus TK-6]